MKSFFDSNTFKISFGTSLSKLAGFTRQIFIAAAFGVGMTYDAYNYAYIIPGFLIIIIGGINGPLHNSIVAVLTPLSTEKAGLIFKKISIKLSIFLLFIGLIIGLNAQNIIAFIGPNLDIDTQLIASKQLQILSPCIPLSGFIGLSFGLLNSKNKFFISSLSPSIISLITILFIVSNWFLNSTPNVNNYSLNSELLALATLTGTLIQFSIQILEISKIGLLKIKTIWGKTLKEEKRIFKLIIPASIASGLGQINVFIDMFFVSSFKGAASGLAYGNFLVQAPLGILSNSLILPLLPKFSKFINNRENKEFKKSLILGIEYCFLTTIFLAGMFITFNSQIVELVFQRGVFNNDAALTVRKILIAYSLGLPFYLLRDLLIRAYYSIEKTKLPFTLSFAGIAINIFFDWILIGGPTKNLGNISPFNFGVTGIVLSSGFVNLIISSILTVKLNFNKEILPIYNLIKKFLLIIISCIFSSLIASLFINNIYQSDNNIILKICITSVGFSIFLLSYFVATKLLKVNKLKFKFLNTKKLN